MKSIYFFEKLHTRKICRDMCEKDVKSNSRNSQVTAGNARMSKN